MPGVWEGPGPPLVVAWAVVACLCWAVKSRGAWCALLILVWGANAWLHPASLLGSSPRIPIAPSLAPGTVCPPLCVLLATSPLMGGVLRLLSCRPRHSDLLWVPGGCSCHSLWLAADPSPSVTVSTSSPFASPHVFPPLYCDNPALSVLLLHWTINTTASRLIVCICCVCSSALACVLLGLLWNRRVCSGVSCSWQSGRWVGGLVG